MTGCFEACDMEGRGAQLRYIGSMPMLLYTIFTATDSTRSYGCKRGVCGIFGGVLTGTGVLSPLGIALIAAGSVIMILRAGIVLLLVLVASVLEKKTDKEIRMYTSVSQMEEEDEEEN